MKLQNPIGQYVAKVQSSEEVQRAKARFAAKPFHEKFKPLKNLAKVGRFLLPLISILTGVAFLQSVLSGVLPVWLAWGAGAVLLTGWEVGKGFLLTVSFESFYSGVKGWAGLFAVALLFSVGSAFFSIRGAGVLHERLDDSVSSFQDIYTARADSIKGHYQTAIREAKEEMEAFKKSVMWKGKIDLYNKTTASTIRAFVSDIERLKEEEGRALAGLASQHEGKLSKVRQKSEFNAVAVASLAFIIDLLIIAIGWYLVYFDFRTAREAQIFTDGGQKVSFNTEAIGQIFEMIQTYTGAGLSLPSATSGGKKQIGFSRNDRGIDTGIKKEGENSQKPYINTGIDTGIDTPSEELRQMRDFLEKYQHVVRDIDKGISIRQCVSKHGVSKTTVQNVKRVMRALDAYE